VLSGLIKRIDSSVQAFSYQDVDLKAISTPAR
jgi:hypothetical protein